MGCGGSQSQQPETVPIKNSLIHLVQSGRTDLIMKKVKEQGSSVLKIKLNFRGDTILHYACLKNNKQLVSYLKTLGGDFSATNLAGQTPIDLAKDPEILSMFQNEEKKKGQKNQRCQTADQTMIENRMKSWKSTPSEVQSQKQQEYQQVAQQNPEINQVKGDVKQVDNLKQQTHLTKLIKAHMEKKPTVFAFQQDE